MVGWDERKSKVKKKEGQRMRTRKMHSGKVYDSTVPKKIRDVKTGLKYCIGQ
jgi:hypothetical protein